MKLADYMRGRMTYRALATLSGVSHSRLVRIAQGEAVSADNAARISAATAGAVSVAELIYPNGLPEGATLVPTEPPSEEAA